MINAYGIKHPDIVMRQLCLESHYLDTAISSSWTNHNNPFGFLLCDEKDSTGTCISWHYLDFDNMEHAIEYYKWWQVNTYDKNFGGEIDYYDFLRRIGYATAPDYISTLKRMW